ncbi:YLP motif-containing protein 1 [Glycine soja]
MDRQWRPPPPPPPNVCPACFHSHFPFCPPPSPFPYANPNFKRPRIDDNPISFSDDERRLKLIRDHGSHTYAPHPNHNGFPPPHNAQFRSSPHPSHRVPDGFLHIGAMQPQPPHQGNQHNFNGRVVHYPYPYPAPNDNNMEAPWFFKGQPQPPLPSSPPPPLPMEPSMNQLKTYFSPPKKPPSLFPVPEPHPMPQPYYPTAFPSEREPSKQQYLGDSQSFAINQLAAERPKVIDASRLFRHPHRASRPDHFVIILRGLPGSGKSYLAKMLRDLEVENGGDAPRIHSMDDYFMTEVEKVEDSEASKSSSSGRSKKLVTKKVMEYFYEPEMEEAYRSSMLKAFKKTVEEGVFTFIIVDDRNLRVADFAQFWATAKRSGYEVYILEATYKDPVGCAARNVHGFTQEDIEKMSKQWEEAPSLYLQLDVKSLFHGDDLKESRIQEVDMDMEDDLGDALLPVQGKEADKVVDPPFGEDASFLKAGKNWDAEEEHPTEVRELGKSKWSEDYGEDDIDQTEGMKGNINALSGLIHHYGKERKSVHWGDQGGKTGFSIGAAKKVNALSLVIGPGAGYNLKSNPLPEEDSPTRNSVDSKKHSIFQEQIRAERESFKAIFDRRRHRIGGLDVEED